MSTPLSTDFKDDVLASSNSDRKYNMIYNSDGTVSFKDVTEYDQTGTEYGAKEVNEERAAINDNTAKLSTLMKTKKFEKSVTFNANARTDFYIPIDQESGYKPVGVMYIDYEGATANLAIGKYSLFSSAFYCSFQNYSQHQQTVTVTAKILYVLDTCVTEYEGAD